MVPLLIMATSLVSKINTSVAFLKGWVNSFLAFMGQVYLGFYRKEGDAAAGALGDVWRYPKGSTDPGPGESRRLFECPGFCAEREDRQRWLLLWRRYVNQPGLPCHIGCKRRILCALPHQKSSPAACLTGDQEFLEGFAADKTYWDDRPPVGSQVVSRISSV